MNAAYAAVRAIWNGVFGPPPLRTGPVTVDQMWLQYLLVLLLRHQYLEHYEQFCEEFGPDDEPRATWDRGGSIEDGYAALFPGG